MPCHKTITAAEAAVLFLENIAKVHGVPQKIISDRDRRFVSEVWQETMKGLGATLAMSTSHHPQTNGLTERTNRSVLQILRCALGGHRDRWVEHVASTEMAYNSAVQSSTKLTPLELDTGRITFLPSNLRDVAATRSVMGRLYVQKLQEAMDRLNQASEQQRRTTARRRQDVQFKVGEPVLLSTTNLAHVPANKLSNPFCGPFTVIQVGANDTYQLDLPQGWGIFPKFHASRLEKFVSRGEGVSEAERREDPNRRFNHDNDPRPQTTATEDESEPLFIMEKITGWKPEGNDIYYKVKWAGYTRETWEPAKEVLDAQGADLIEEFRHRWNTKYPENPFATGETDAQTTPSAVGGV